MIYIILTIVLNQLIHCKTVGLLEIDIPFALDFLILYLALLNTTL